MEEPPDSGSVYCVPAFRFHINSIDVFIFIIQSLFFIINIIGPFITGNRKHIRDDLLFPVRTYTEDKLRTRNTIDTFMKLRNKLSV